MILPILRLVLIYLLLVAGVVAVFNRDKLAPLLPGARDRDARAETSAPEAPAPLAEVPEFEPSPDEATPPATPPATPSAGSGEGGQDAGEPVFPDPTQIAPSDGTAAPATEVTPAPGIAPQTPPLQQAPADTAVQGQGTAPAAPTAPEEAADAPAQPAKPGSPAPLGTPVAPAPQGSGAAAQAEAPAAPDVPTPDTATNAAPAEAAPQTPPTPDTAPPTAPAEAAPQTAPTPGQPGATADGADGSAALVEAIGAARSAYWAGDIEGARARMEALAAAYPDNPDVAGELGNLAFALRDYPAAAEAWHRAGLLLIERGESARVMSFLPFLQSIAPDKAAELAARLQDR